MDAERGGDAYPVAALARGDSASGPLIVSASPSKRSAAVGSAS
jgi:hypothetical protein